MTRTVGVEEELLLVDPGTGRMAPRAPQVVRDDDGLDLELLRHQVETQTEPGTDLAAAREGLVAARGRAGRAAREAGLAAVACGIVPRDLERPVPSPADRYRDIAARYGEVARTAGTCAMHVHVAVEGDEEGVGVIDRVTPWLPLLTAVAANSPFAGDRDTGYASWRAQVWDRWPTAGPLEPFGSARRYHEVCGRLVDSGAARDHGMLYLDARLSADQPTVEVRVADVCTDPDDAVLVAALVRGLVETAAREHAAGAPAPTVWPVAVLRASRWRASRYGVGERLLVPGDDGRELLRTAREALDALVSWVSPALAEAGDADLVAAGTERVLAGGGAARQRAAHERSGDVAGVVADLVERTERSWQDPAD